MSIPGRFPDSTLLRAGLIASALLLGTACDERPQSAKPGAPIARPTAPAPTSEWSLASALPIDRLTRLARAAAPDASGAMSRNRDGYVSVRFQAGLSWPLTYAGLSADPAGAEQTVRAMEYAAKHQRPDGSFEIAGPDAFDGRQGTPGDSANAAAVYVAEAARALRLAATSSASSSNPLTPALRTRYDAQVGVLRRALRSLGAHAAVLSQADGSAPDRLLADAMAFYVGGVVTGDEASIATGIRFAESALAGQRADGVFVQSGGHDSSYQGVTLLRAILLYANLRSQDAALGGRLRTAIEKGMAWQSSRVLASGEVSAEGNTRVREGGEQALGQTRPIATSDVAVGLYYWTAVSGNGTYRAAAERLVTYYVD